MKRLIFVVAFATCILQINAEKFSCEGRASGYYADVNTGCQVYHMCDGLGRQFSYSCPNTTLFQQRMLICDHWYMVNCSKSEIDYKANLLIGQRDKPFVEDSSEHPYHRTPRPDLLDQPHSPSNRDDEYRQGRAHQRLPSSLNLVGVATDDDAEDELGRRRNYTTDRPQYFLPSHWSTQYGKHITTPIPLQKPSKLNSQFIGKASVDKKFSNIDFKDIKNRDVLPPPPPPPPSPPVKKQIPLPVPLPLPIQNGNKVFINPRVDENIPDSINQESVSPSSLALPPFVPSKTLPQPQKNIPISVPNIEKPSIFYQPPKLSPPIIEVESTTMDPQSFYKLIPSKDLLPPPLIQPQLPVSTTTTITTTTTTPQPNNPTPLKITLNTERPQQQSQQQDHIETINISEKRWKELRQMFFIPEYDFPLETGSRPSYESGLSSFQVNAAPPIPESLRRPPAPPSPVVAGQRTINPDCPKCDPAFLAPGTCKPCVMIR